MNEVIEHEVVESSTSMIKLDGAVKALAEASTLEDVKHIADVAEAAKTYAKAARLGLKAQNKAAEIHLRAQRKAGEMLASMEKNKGGRPDETGNIVLPVSPSLKDLGIDKMQSSRWQRIASLSEDEFEAHLDDIRQSNREITTASVLALGRGTSNITRNSNHGGSPTIDGQWQALIDAGTRFGTIYADPPWVNGHRGTSMTVNQLCALPVELIAADDAHLHLWTTDAHLFEAKQVIDAWGFDYAGCFVWIKPEANVGNHWQVSHEFLLLGVRGSCSFLDGSLTSWGEIEPAHDGRKPEAVRQLIERASPEPRIELFANQAASGWTVWDRVDSNVAHGVEDGFVGAN
jgi:N6-adenosine-specific RNA methylase IME4